MVCGQAINVGVAGSNAPGSVLLCCLKAISPFPYYSALVELSTLA